MTIHGLGNTQIPLHPAETRISDEETLLKICKWRALTKEQEGEALREVSTAPPSWACKEICPATMRSLLFSKNGEILTWNIETGEHLQIPLKFDSPITSLLLSSEKLKIYWALGSEKWKECIDGCYIHFGKMVFDQGLHNSRQVEPGFIESMENAFAFIGNSLGTPITISWWRQLHSIACKHFRGAATKTLIGVEDVGKFRNLQHHTCYQVNRRMTPEGEKEFNQTELGTLTELDSKGKRTLYYKLMCSEEISRLFQKYIDAFYKEISSSSHERLTAIARFYQMVEWLHPPPDGTGRCDLAMLNKLLTEYGFHPVILDRPYMSSTNSLKDWTAYLEKGLIKWELAALQIKPLA